MASKRQRQEKEMQTKSDEGIKLKTTMNTLQDPKYVIKRLPRRYVVSLHHQNQNNVAVSSY